MIFSELALAGAWTIDPVPVGDARGAFARLLDVEALAAHGLVAQFAQASVSFNARAGTLRGLHLQRPPYAEVKIVRATAGAVWDVLVDLRAGSPTYARWTAVELDAGSRRQVYIPAGIAHGFQALTDGAELTYLISAPYAPDAQDGVRWDDPALAIAWPDPAGAILSERDRALPPLADFRPVDVRC